MLGWVGSSVVKSLGSPGSFGETGLVCADPAEKQVNFHKKEPYFLFCRPLSQVVPLFLINMSITSLFKSVIFKKN